MKYFNTSMLIIGITLFSLIGYSQSVSLNVTTVTDGGTYSPKHILAIWVKNSNGTFVKSMKVMANSKIQYLYTWKANSASNKVDAVTGSTLTTHQSHTVSWNCKNVSNTVVPNGDYKLMIEYTDKHAQGPMDSIFFTVSGNSQSITPVDLTYFKNVSLVFTPATTGINENTTGNQLLSVYPNPSNGLFYVSLTSEEVGVVTLKVIDLKGSIIRQETIEQSKLNGYPIELSANTKGLYILELTCNGKSISQKVVIQ